MKYNPKNHHRRSIRLRGYDYSQAGLYFITICCQNRECLFGEIAVGADLCVCPEMICNDAGKMIGKWYRELENKFNDIKCNQMIIMPNHIHFIVQNVGADLCVCPDNATTGNATTKNTTTDNTKTKNTKKGEHTGSPLHRVVQWFKTMTTNEYIRGVKTNGWRRFDKKLWQRNYWEHIIRNENEYQRIAEYMINNPIKWNMDKLNDVEDNMVMESQPQYTVGSNLYFRPNKEEWMI